MGTHKTSLNLGEKSGVAASAPEQPDAFVHGAVLGMNEQGIETARPGPPKRSGRDLVFDHSKKAFQVLRPFALSISEKKSGCILMLARIVRPESSGG